MDARLTGDRGAIDDRSYVAKPNTRRRTAGDGDLADRLVGSAEPGDRLKRNPELPPTVRSGADVGGDVSLAFETVGRRDDETEDLQRGGIHGLHSAAGATQTRAARAGRAKTARRATNARRATAYARRRSLRPAALTSAASGSRERRDSRRSAALAAGARAAAGAAD